MLKKEFEEALVLVEKGLSKFKGDEEEYDTLLEIYRDLHRDLKIAIKRQDLVDDNPTNDYRKVMKVMQKTELTYGERSVKEFREKVANEAVRLLKIEMQEQMQEQMHKMQEQMKEQIEQIEQKTKEQMQEQMQEQIEQIEQKTQEQMKEQIEQIEQKSQEQIEQIEQKSQEQIEQKTQEQMQNDRKSIARNLLPCMNDSEISVITGLSIEEVILIREEKN